MHRSSHKSVLLALLVLLVLLAAPTLAAAQEGSPGAAKKWSASTGIGFAADVVTQSGFLWQVDAQYRMQPSFSLGATMQVIPVTGGTAFNLTGDARYHFGVLRTNSNEVVKKLTPYVGVGMGLGHLGPDSSAIPGQQTFLLSLIAGLEYDLTNEVALTSDMRFNIATIDLFGDNFQFSWQMVGVRYRF